MDQKKFLADILKSFPAGRNIIEVAELQEKTGWPTRTVERLLDACTPEDLDGRYFRFSNALDAEDEWCHRQRKALFRTPSQARRGRPDAATADKFSVRFKLICLEWLKQETRAGRCPDYDRFLSAVVGNNPSPVDVAQFMTFLHEAEAAGRIERDEHGNYRSLSTSRRTVDLIYPRNYREGSPGTRSRRGKPLAKARWLLEPAEPAEDNRPVTQFTERLPPKTQSLLNRLEEVFTRIPQGVARSDAFIEDLKAYYASPGAYPLSDSDVVRRLVGLSKATTLPIVVLKTGRRVLNALVERGLLEHRYVKPGEFGNRPDKWLTSAKKYVPVVILPAEK